MPGEVDLVDRLRSLRSLVFSARSTSLGTCSLPRDSSPSVGGSMQPNSRKGDLTAIVITLNE